MRCLKANNANERLETIYVEILRKMTGEDRMKQAFDMCKFMWKIAAESILNQYPNISEAELHEKLKQRLRR